MPYALRPVQPEDTPFLFRVYASTRADELAAVGWDTSQQDAFLRMQFKLQTEGYRQQFPDARYEIVLHDGYLAGRIIVARNNNEIRLIDLALLPEHRGLGIGSALIASLQAEAVQFDKPLRLHVEVFNRARRLYERLGFIPIEMGAVYLELEWRPGSPLAANDRSQIVNLGGEPC
ncbi:MAG TPA: GNAT family N-acetyltransferase [Chloroflexota bacterium]|nr:GNAT family N-acetyltransferase [Chloroflexota bacterium]